MSAMGMTIYDLLRRSASMYPSANAIVHEGGTLSYAELSSRVDRLAAGFAGLGLAHGTRVCVLAQNHLEYFELYFACAKLGLVVYPVNWRLTATEIGHVLTRAEPAVMVFDQEMATLTAEVRELESASKVSHWYCIDGAADNAGAIADLYVHGDSPQTSTSADDIAVVISTAAVDVIPRGAALTSANIAANNVQIMMSMGLKNDECHLLCLPMFHITGLGFAWAMIHCGGCNVITTKFDPAAAVSLIDKHNVTLLGSFPPLLATLLDQADAAGSKLESLRHVAGLEAPDTAKRLQDSTNATFWIGFGQSETSGFVSVQPYFERPGSAGKPAALSQVELRDDDGQTVPVGEVGEIVVRGPVVMHSYFGQPDVTEHTFRDGWHHTGDLGRFDEDGYLTLMDRAKDLVISGGSNIYPREIEEVLLQHPNVSEVSVIGRTDPEWGEIPVAYVVGQASPPELDSLCLANIARFKRPKDYVFVDELPKNNYGKILKSELRKRDHG